MNFFISLKSTLLKIFIVGFVFFYILSPVQTQIYSLLHKISHQLVSENHHNEERKVNNHNVRHDHEFLSSHSSENKHHHGKKEPKTNHSHELLSFLSAVFKTENSQNDKGKQFFEVKLDKHILPNKRISQEQFTLITTPQTWFYNLKTDSLGLDVITPPPQAYSF